MPRGDNKNTTNSAQSRSAKTNKSSKRSSSSGRTRRPFAIDLSQTIAQRKIALLDLVLEDEELTKAAAEAVQQSDSNVIDFGESKEDKERVNILYRGILDRLSESARLAEDSQDGDLDLYISDLRIYVADLAFQAAAHADGYQEPELLKVDEIDRAKPTGPSSARGLLYGNRSNISGRAQAENRRQRAESDRVRAFDNIKPKKLYINETLDDYAKIEGMTVELFARWHRLFTFSADEYKTWSKPFEGPDGQERAFSPEQAFRLCEQEGIDYQSAVNRIQRLPASS